MYAVIANGGKQYRVAPGEVVKLEKIESDVGATVEFDQVLLVVDGQDIKIGTPLLAGITVCGEIVDHGRGEKIRIVKFRRRKHHMKQMGHRQDFTKVKITSIAGKKYEEPVRPVKDPAVKAEKPKKAAKTKTPAKKKAVAKKTKK
jgi:large subunit ribosomal protein L21